MMFGRAKLTSGRWDSVSTLPEQPANLLPVSASRSAAHTALAAFGAQFGRLRHELVPIEIAKHVGAVAVDKHPAPLAG